MSLVTTLEKSMTKFVFLMLRFSNIGKSLFKQFDTSKGSPGSINPKE